MENAPPDNLEAPKEKSSDKKKRRKPFELGRAVIDMDEPKREAPPPPPKEEKPDDGWLSRFTEKPKEVSEESKEGSEEADETVSEAEAPSDGTLSEEERQTVIQALVQEASQNLPEHDTEDDPEEVAADILLAEFYDKLDSNPDIEAAASEIIEAAGIELAAEDELEPLAEAEAADRVPGWDEELVFDRSAEARPIDLEDEEDPAIAGGGTPAGAATGGLAGSGAVPPAGPGPLHGHRPGSGSGAGAGGPGVPVGPAAGRFGGSPAIPGFNYAPLLPLSPNRPVRTESIRDRANPAVFFVAGGIIGYLIGRRRGRIKTEKKLLPVQKKLEKQVEDLHWEIKAKESKIRKVAAEKVRQEGPAVVEALAAKRAAKAEQKASVLPIKVETVTENRQKAPEANVLHGAKAHEHLAHMLMTAESIPAAATLPKVEQASPVKAGRLEVKQSAEQAKPALTEKSVETLNRSQLLQLSEQIIVDGTSLRQIYETNLVGERGLRRLVTEHLRGGDLSKALRNEVVEREIDFERDPVMRDIAPGGSSPSGSGGAGGTDSTPTLNQMLEKAAAALPASDEEAAFYKARAAYETDQSNKQRKHQQLVDISFAGTILVLLSAVIYLFITRG